MKLTKLLFVFCLIGNVTYANDCANINGAVTKIMSQNQIAGIAIAIIHDNQTEFCNYGYANKITKSPITNKSIFEIASLTKTFTALLVGIAASQNKLDLQTPIANYLPALAANPSYTKINLQELLTHVSGLPIMFDGLLTENSLIDSAVHMKFTTAPGTYYQYSNPAFALAGLALTRIYKADFQSLLNNLILNKLGMIYTSITVSARYQNLIVTGYGRNNQPTDFINLGVENPAGGLKSNTSDLAKYLRLQMSITVPIFQQALVIVHKNYYCLYQNGTYQQLAWEYHPVSDLTRKFQPNADNQNILPSHTLPTQCKTAPNGFIDKTGNFPGTTTYMGYIPNQKIGVVILANRALQPDVVNLGRLILQQAR